MMLFSGMNVAEEPLFGLLQSWEWGEFKRELGWKVFRIAVKDDRGRIIAGAQMLIEAIAFRTGKHGIYSTRTYWKLVGQRDC